MERPAGRTRSAKKCPARREKRQENVEALFELAADAEHMVLTDTRPLRPVSLAARRAEQDKRQSEPDPTSAFFTIVR